MSSPKKTTIDLNEDFKHLPNAPIVEAVIHWQAPAGKALDKSTLHEELSRRFPDYEAREQHEVRATVQANPGEAGFRQQTRWDGFRLVGKGPADHYIAQFMPNGVAFSRLKPYDDWDAFQNAALIFWEAYLELAEPPVIERVGVRFINQISLTYTDKYSDFLKPVSESPLGSGLASESFFHQDSYRVAGYPYRINWVRTVPSTTSKENVLIVDIEVSTEGVKSLEREMLTTQLAEMRYLKDKLFFSCMTDQAIERFKKEHHE